MQVPHTLLDLALGETAPRPQLTQRHGAVRDHDGHTRLVDTLVPVAPLLGLLGQLGGALGLEKLVKLGGALSAAGQLVLLSGAIPVGRPGLEAAQLVVGGLEAGPQCQTLLEIIGGLSGAAQREVGGGAFEVG